MESGAEPPVARRLRCVLAELVDAFDDASWEMSVYLDLDTGEVIHITAEVREELEAIYAELPEEQTDEEANKAAFASAIERRSPPAWMHDLLTEADAVESGLGTRFLRLPQRDSHESYMDMQAFIETVAHPRLEERLWAAIRVAVPSAASRTCSLSIQLSASAGSLSKLLGCASGCWPGWRTTGSSSSR